jgi:hypothetical protein
LLLRPRRSSKGRCGIERYGKPYTTDSIDRSHSKLTAPTERGRHQPRQESRSPIHHHRHRLKVPAHAAHLVLRRGIRRAARHHPRRWQRSLCFHRRQGCRKVRRQDHRRSPNHQQVRLLLLGDDDHDPGVRCPGQGHWPQVRAQLRMLPHYSRSFAINTSR